MKRLPLSFYQNDDVVAIARNLLGKGLFTFFGEWTGGIIIETEAYAGTSDRASHAFSGRRTERNDVMYGPGGRSYIYLCYGMHHLLNAVTAGPDTPHAILIRAILPTKGIDQMLQRRHKKSLDKTLSSGPGALCQALGITREWNGHPLNRKPIVICEMGIKIPPDEITASPRIGVDYAGKDAFRPYRFQIIHPSAMITIG